jgi:hypothetical protein
MDDGMGCWHVGGGVVDVVVRGGMGRGVMGMFIGGKFIIRYYFFNIH